MSYDSIRKAYTSGNVSYKYTKKKQQEETQRETLRKQQQEAEAKRKQDASSSSSGSSTTSTIDWAKNRRDQASWAGKTDDQVYQSYQDAIKKATEDEEKNEKTGFARFMENVGNTFMPGTFDATHKADDRAKETVDNTVLYYTDDGEAVTYSSLIRDRENTATKEKMDRDANASPIVEQITAINKDIENLYKNETSNPTATPLYDEENGVDVYGKYGIDYANREHYDLERAMKSAKKKLVKQLKELGYDYDELEDWEESKTTSEEYRQQDKNDFQTYADNDTNFDKLTKEGKEIVDDKWYTTPDYTYSGMTDDQIDYYNYYVAMEKKGLVAEGTAKGYKDTIQTEINQRKAAGIAELYDDHTILETAFGVAAGIDSHYEGMKNAITGVLFGENERYVTPSVLSLAGQQIKQDLEDNGKDAAGVVYDLTSTVTNMIPTLAINMMTGGLGGTVASIGSAAANAVMGISSAGNSYQEYINSGMNQSQARALSAIQGTWEAASEKFLGSLELIGNKKLAEVLGNTKVMQKIAKVSHGAINAFIDKFAIDPFQEGMEEVIQDIGSTLWEGIFTGELDWSSPEEQAYNFVLGALSSFGINLGLAPFSKASNVLNARDIRNNGSVEQLLEAGKSFEDGSRPNRLANKYNNDTSAWKLSKLVGSINNNIGNQTEADVANALMAKGMSESEALSNAKWMTELEEGKSASKVNQAKLENNPIIAEVYGEMTSSDFATNKRYTNLRQAYGKTGSYGIDTAERDEYNAALNKARAINSILDHVDTQTETATVNSLENNIPLTSQRTSSDIANQANYVKSMSANNVLSNPKTNEFKTGLKAANDEIVRQKAAKRLSVDTLDIVSNVDRDNGVEPTKVTGIEDGQLTVETKSGETATTSNVVYKDEVTALVYESAAGLVSELNSHGIDIDTTAVNQLIAMQESSGIAPETFFASADEGIRNGYINNVHANVNDNVLLSTVSPAARDIFFKIGRDASATTTEEKTAAVKSSIAKSSIEEETHGRVRLDGGLNYAGMTDIQKASTSALGRMAAKIVTGTNVVIFNSVPVKDKSGRVIDYQFSNEIEELKGIEEYQPGHHAPNGFYLNGTIFLNINAGDNGEGSLLWTAAHEFTHMMRVYSPSDFKALADFVVEALGKNGTDVAELIQRQIDKAKYYKRTLTYDEAYEEVIADSMTEMLTRTDAQEKMEQLKTENKGLWQKIKDFFEKLRKKLAKEYDKLGNATPEVRAMRKLGEEIDRICDLFATGMVNAGETAAKIGSIEGATAKDSQQERDAIESLGNNLDHVVRDLNGSMLVATTKDKSKVLYSEVTYNNGGRSALYAALKEAGHDDTDILVTLEYVDKKLEKIKEYGQMYANQHFRALSDNLNKDVTRDIATGKQVIYAFTSNGDYPANIDLQLECKKRIAYGQIMKRLIADGVLENVRYGGEAIAEVNMILAENEFETACLGCFVESRRLQFQNWAETFVSEWNEAVAKYNKNADYFFTPTGNAISSEDAISALATLENEEKNEKGNIKLASKSVAKKMVELIGKNPEFYAHKLSVADILTPEGLKKVRSEIGTGDIFSLLKQRYGAASPKIVQDFNPYNAEILKLTFDALKDMTGSKPSSDKYIKEAKEQIGTSLNEEAEAHVHELYGEKVTKAVMDKEVKKYINAKAAELAFKNYLFDVGGLRVQSFSDFMVENTFDMLQMYIDMAAKGFPIHGYTKEISCVRLFGMTGGKWNGSLIAHVDRDMDKEHAGLMPYTEENAEHGIPVKVGDEQFVIQFDDYNRHRDFGKFSKSNPNGSFIQSIGYKDIIATMLDPRYSKHIGNITIGVSDIQIRAMLNNPLFRMVIPYHSSGMIPGFAELVGVNFYNDYTDYQNTTPRTATDLNGKQIAWKKEKGGKYSINKNGKLEEVDASKVTIKKDKNGRLKCKVGKETYNVVADNSTDIYKIVIGGEFTKVSFDMSYDFNKKMNELGDARAAAAAYVEWCDEQHEITDEDGKVVGYITYNAKFSNSPYGYDFAHNEPNYYKLLEDFNVYDTLEEVRSGGANQVPALQQAVEIKYAGDEGAKLSQEELETYANDLRNTGLFTEKEITKYVGKAQQTWEEILKDAVDEREDYHSRQDPKLESTYQEIKKHLEDNYSRTGRAKTASGYISAKDKANKALSSTKKSATPESRIAEANKLSLKPPKGGYIKSDYTFKESQPNPKDQEYLQLAKEYDESTGANMFSKKNYDKLNYMVRNAATEAGAITGANGKARTLYHGSQDFGFTSFDKSMMFHHIYATTKSEVSANYGGRGRYAGVRQINRKYKGGSDVQSIIDDAKSVLDATYARVTTADRTSVMDKLEADAQRISDKIDELQVSDSPIEIPDEIYQAASNACDIIWTVTGYAEDRAYDLRNNKNYANPELTVSYLESGWEKFEEAKQVIADWIQDNFNALKGTDTYEYFRYLAYDHDLFDTALDAYYKYRRVIDKNQTLLINKSSSNGRITTAESLRADLDRMHEVGSYQLYGFAGDKMLTVDAGGNDWLVIKCPEMDDQYHSTDTIANWAQENGYTSVLFKNLTDGGEHADEYVFFDPEQVKSADVVTYDDDGNIIPLSERFNKKNNDIRYSEQNRTEYAPTFYSQMGKVIDGIKTEKIGAGGVVSYLKGKGVKDEEIKWSGIEAFLEGKKSVTKQDLQAFVAGSMLQIEEETRGSEDVDRFVTLWRGLIDPDAEPSDFIFNNEQLQIGTDYLNAMVLDEDLSREDADELISLMGKLSKENANPSKWSQYTIKGGTNYRELLFKMPGATFSNTAMRTHWETSGVLAHARVQDYTTADGKNMLFIEEIQSDWHNEGQYKGFRNLSPEYEQMAKYRDRLESEYHSLPIYEQKSEKGKEMLDEYAKITRQLQEDNVNFALAPDAPFAGSTDSYVPYVLKRLIRMAAEKGYDSIGWTTAQQQDKRWADKSRPHKDDEGRSGNLKGYTIEYDQDIPGFLKKYGKKWGASVGKTILPVPTSKYATVIDNIQDAELNIGLYEEDLEDNPDDAYATAAIERYKKSIEALKKDGQVWSMDITDEMKNSVLYEGQPMYSNPNRFPDNNWHTNMTNREVTEVESIAKWEAYRTENYLGNNAKWLYNTQKGHIYFAIYSIAGNDAPVVMYARKGAGATNEYRRLLEIINIVKETSSKNDRSRTLVDRILDRIGSRYGDDNLSGGNTAKGRGSNKNAQLHSKNTRNRLSQACYNCLKNISDLSARVPDGEGDGGLNTGSNSKPSEQNPDATDNRTILSNALMSTAINDTERKWLKKYQDKISDINKKQSELAEVRKQIHDISFTKGSDRTQLPALQAKAKTLAESISRDDKKLLEIESTEMLKKLLIREREKAVKRVEEKSRNALKEYRENRTESLAVKTQREKLQKAISKTIKWITAPAKGELPCPDVLAGPYSAFLQSITMDSVRKLKGGDDTQKDLRNMAMMDNLVNTIDRITKAQDPDSDDDTIDQLDAGYLDLPADFVEDFRNCVDIIKELMINNAGSGMSVVNRMNSTELKDLNNLIKLFNHSILTMDKTYQNARFQSAEALGRATMKEVESLKKMQDGKVYNFLEWDNATPYYVFKRMGPAAQSIFEEMQDAQDKLAFLSAEILEYKDEHWTDKEAKEWGNDTHTIELLDNKKVTLTSAQAMSIYCLAKREQAKGHLLGGGIRVIGLTNKRGKKAEDSRTTLRVEDIATITASLTDRQIEVADAMQKFMSTVCADWGNEISYKRFLKNMFGEEFYFPIESNDENMTVKDPEKQQSDLFRLLNISATKATVKKANNQLVIRDIFEVFANHTSDMAKLNSFGMALLDTMKWFNYREKSRKDQRGNFTTRGVRKTLNETFGSAANSYILKLIKDINGSTRDTKENGMLMTLIKNSKTASVAANLRVALLQMTALPRARLVLSDSSIAGALLHKPQVAKSKEKSGIALWKSFGFFDTNINRSMEEKIRGGGTWKDTVIEYALAGAGLGDDITWGYLWNACEIEIAKTGLKKGTEEFEDAVAHKFRDVVYSSQVVDSTLTRSQAMRNKSGLWQMVTAFMSEPTLSYNVLLDAYNENIQKGRATAHKYVCRAVSTYMISALVAGVAEGLFDALRDDDDESFLSKWFAGTWQNTLQDLLIVGKVPIFKDVESLILDKIGIGYYNSERMDTAWLTAFSTVWDTWAKIIEKGDESTYTIYKGLYDTVNAFSKLSGLPMAAAVREVVTFWNNTVGTYDSTKKIRKYKLDDGTVREEMYEAMSSGDSDRLSKLKNKYDDVDMSGTQVNDALKAGDTKLAKQIADDIVAEKMKDGKTKKEARSSVKAALTKEWKPIYKAASTTERATIRKNLYATGLYDSVNDVVKMCNNWLKD